MKLFRIARSAQASVLILVVSGCSTQEMGHVRGKIVMDGQPLPKAYVELWPKSDLSLGSFMGTTDDDGNFDIAVDGNSGRVRPGRFLALVEKRVANPKRPRAEFSAEMLPPGMGINLVADIFSDKKRCPLEVDLVQGGSQLGVLEVKAKAKR